MQARSALFDLYGDHLRPRGGHAPVAALVRLLAPLGIAPPAVRTAVSRMVRQGWLRPLRLANAPGYALTPKAVRRLDDAATRIYRTGTESWNDEFDLIIVSLPASRTERTRIAANLGYLGYAPVDSGSWIATRPNAEADTLLEESGLRYDRFTAVHAAGTPGAEALVRRAWDLTAIGDAYLDFIRRLHPVVADVPGRGDDERAYAARFELVHAWRSFLFRDPRLPAALLPPQWPGTKAAAFFDHHAARLRPAADRHVDRCLEAAVPV